MAQVDQIALVAAGKVVGGQLFLGLLQAAPHRPGIGSGVVVQQAVAGLQVQNIIGIQQLHTAAHLQGNLPATAALDALEQDAAERSIPFVIVSVAEPMIERIEAVRPGKFTFSHDSEDGDDYIYLAEKLRTLSGKKLQSKRNLVNRFKTAYEGRWSYEDMTRENIKDAFAFHIHWCNLNGCARERDFEGETCAIVQALHNFDYLNLRGGLLRLDGEVIAFTFGCKATPDMFVVQIEKADHTIQGAYQMINQQFVQRNCNDVEYVNREEDLGLEGLRKAKKSYYPVMRGVKYMAVPKG